MNTEVQFRNLDRTESLDQYLRDKIESVAEDFFKHDPDTHITVRVETIRARVEGRKPLFMCEVILKPTKSKGTIKLVKTSNNFFDATHKTVMSLKNILGRRSERLTYARKHEDRRVSA